MSIGRIALLLFFTLLGLGFFSLGILVDVDFCYIGSLCFLINLGILPRIDNTVP